MADSFAERLATLPQPFTRAEAHHAFPDLNPNTVNVYLSRMTTEGRIFRVGPNRYAIPGTIQDWNLIQGEVAPPQPPTVHHVGSALASQLHAVHVSRCIVWGAESFPGHDAFPNPWVVLEAPEDLLEIVAPILSRRHDLIPLEARHRLKGALQHMTLPSERRPLFIVPSRVFRGTWPTREGYRVPTPARLLQLALSLDFPIEVARDIVRRDDFNVREALHPALPGVVAFLTLMARDGDRRIAHELVRITPRLGDLL